MFNRIALIVFFILHSLTKLNAQENTTRQIINLDEVICAYPNNYNEKIERNGITIYIYNSKSKDSFDITSDLVFETEDKLDSKFDDYIKKQKQGLIGINLVGKKEIQEHLKERKESVLKTYNRKYYGIINKNNQLIVRIEFYDLNSNKSEFIDYNLKEDKIESFYNYRTY